MTDFDAIVLGAGPAGEVCAGELSSNGLRTAVVERELVGGECSYWACIPSKTLLRPGEALEGARHAPGAREAVQGGLHAAEALAWRDFMVSDHDDAGATTWLDDMNITLLRGEGVITGPGRISVDGTEHTARFIVVATGSAPFIPPVEGLRDLDGVWTNREATALEAVPESLVVLGGGPVGVELAQGIHRLGAAQVTLVESAPRVLAHEAPEVGDTVGRALRAEGLDLRLGVHASRISRDDGGFHLRLDDGDEITAARLLVATGRRPRGEESGAASAGATIGAHGHIQVDEQLKAADGLWAIGDCVPSPAFTHVGKYEARIAARAILGKPARADYRAVPRVVFCDPEAAGAGATEGERQGTAALSGVARTATYTRDYAELEGHLTLLADGEKLVGAHAVGPEAGEWLGQATLAIRAEVPVDVLRDTIQPFPTFSEAFVTALEDLG